MPKTPADIFDPIINQAASEWNVDPRLAKALLLAESNGNWRAQSGAGASGLMQLMPETAKTLGVEDIWNPTQNIYGGVKYLSQALDAEGQDPYRALLYYHGGPGWRNSYGQESQAYPGRVAEKYKLLAPSDAAAPQSPQTAQSNGNE